MLTARIALASCLALAPVAIADTLLGNSGRDWLFGGDGRDTLWGDIGTDRLIGGQGADRLNGGDGDDLLFGGTGFDALLGGPSNDRLYSTASDGARDVVDCGPGTDAAMVRAEDRTLGCERVTIATDVHRLEL